MFSSGNISTITATLLYDNLSAYHNPTSGVVPYSDSVDFVATLGAITDVKMTDGIATSTFTAGTSSGTANITATVDNQTVTTPVTIANEPKVSGIDPTNGAVINNNTKVIIVTFNKSINKGSGTIQLKNSSGINIAITTTLNSKTITINHALLADGTYTVVLPAGCLVDSDGNKLAAYSSKFTVDTVKPTVTSSSPASGATNVAASKTITVTFSEAIKKGSSFVVKLLNSSGTAIAYTYSISGKVLIIDPKSNLAESKYKLVLYSGCVTDLAGNSFAGKTISFSVGTSPQVTSSNPTNGATKVARNKTITVTFNEAIQAGSNYKIVLKASNGTAVIIKKIHKWKSLNNHSLSETSSKNQIHTHNLLRQHNRQSRQPSNSENHNIHYWKHLKHSFFFFMNIIFNKGVNNF